MSREECEQAILAKAAEIAGIVKQYEPDNRYFNLCIIDLEKCSFNNRYWESDKPIDTPYLRLDGGTDDD